MTLGSFTADDLFDWLTQREDILLLDVRNDVEFSRFQVEGPYPFDMVNVPYMEFIEMEDESVARVPRGKRVRIVCAKEGSSKYVGEILVNHGFENVAHMQVGIKAWGNLLVPARVARGKDYELYQFRRPGKASCSYGLIHGEEMMVFDPAKNIDFYLDFARNRGATITKTFETHRQADYISGSEGLRRRAAVEIVAPEDDFQGARFPYTPARHGDLHRFRDGGPEVEVIHTPGHTPGSTCYRIDGQYLVTGDTVFIQSIGRPDLGGMAESWSNMLFKTMTEFLLSLDEDTLILPGHYMDWREADDNLIFAAPMGKIKERNADIYAIDKPEDFYAFIQANMRSQPEEYARIREINAGLVEVDEEQQEIMDIGKNECAASMHAAA
ncbi:MAG: MBL fold metallo-hydrolase [Desulfobacterales bacterium]|jgi:glyoxylase-like metal-dependent hydrolase (beta-lactamase superfamily II)